MNETDNTVVSRVILSDGKECRVRALGLFELDGIPRPDAGPFTYQMTMLGGEVKQAEFDLDAWDEPPVKPDIPEHRIREKTEAWYDMRDYQLYQAAEAHRDKQARDLIAYCEAAAAYVRDHCIDPEDVPRIVTEEDWEAVYRAALVPPLTHQLLADTLRNTYSATYNDEEIFDALEKTSGGRGSVNALRLWENQTMLRMQMSEMQWAALPRNERARKVCAHMLDKWLEHLEVDRYRKEREREK